MLYEKIEWNKGFGVCFAKLIGNSNPIESIEENVSKEYVDEEIQELELELQNLPLDGGIF